MAMGVVSHGPCKVMPAIIILYIISHIYFCRGNAAWLACDDILHAAGSIYIYIYASHRALTQDSS